MKHIITHIARRLATIATTIVRFPRLFVRSTLLLPEFCRGLNFADQWPLVDHAEAARDTPNNPLLEYFTKHHEGPGIWKWTHYFDAYHRHFCKFRGSSVNLLEIGIYSGGSLPMWLQYFGERCQVFGVDIEDACKAYENERIHVFIGDQESREFWRRFRQSAPEINIVIDDGGHTPEQQMTTLEEMLPHMPPGGVYVCEDIHGISNEFTAFATALVHRLNAMQFDEKPGVNSSNLQRALHSIHFYPYLLVIEIHDSIPERLIAPKHGTVWQPFL